MKLHTILTSIGLLSLIILGCAKGDGLKQVKLTLGVAGESFSSQLKKIDGQISIPGQHDLGYYSVSWPTDDRGSVVIDHGKYSFTVPHLLSMAGYEDMERSDGIEKFDFRGGMLPSGKVSHDETRVLFLAFLQQLKSLGWQQQLYYSAPRITGHESVEYQKTENFHSLPLDYSFTFEEWMALDRAYWYLRADNAFLEITIRRDPSLMDPEKYGSYLFSFEFYNINHFIRGQLSYEDRNNWRNVLPSVIEELKNIRYEREAELVLKGYTIDETYKDPEIPY